MAEAARQKKEQVEVMQNEGEISLADQLQQFYTLKLFGMQTLCPIQTTKGGSMHQLQPLLNVDPKFELEITDARDTTTTTLSNNLAERLLSLTAEQIYEIVAVKIGEQKLSATALTQMVWHYNNTEPVHNMDDFPQDEGHI
ncbi:hypothetical protein RND71_014292 [Anisodus tanguticus]|uniref:Uncharacterized protein n=1 Tax=Anisodus tanguticus TaxID=243964 RepID=A0AAE1VEX9_9SOLA|nr:hypothetical protein RND71_014292 [Anisodus tanguticus]